MTLKELVKEVEKTNELLKSIGKKELEIWLDVDDCINMIKTSKDLRKLMKEYSVLSIELKDEFLNKEITLKETFTLTYTRHDGWETTYKIRINVY